MGVYLPGASRLPSTYQEVEWIGSSATQYINTGYIPTINTEIETDLSWGSSQAEWGVFFGMTSNDNWQDGICGRIYSSSPTIFNPRFLNSAYGECQITTTTDTFHKVILKKNYCTLDGTAGTLTTTYSSPYSGAIYLFCGNNGGSAWRHTSVKFKSFKISESGTLQRNFVPCYRKSDNVIGLYDLVNNQFYTNSGSGTFTKGADVSGGELSNAFIGYAYSPGDNTIAYYPLTSTTTNTDIVNSRNFTTFGGVTYETLSSGLSVARLSGSSSGNSNKLVTGTHTWYNIGTMSIWAKPEATTGTYPNRYVLIRAGINYDETISLFTAWNGVYNARSLVSSNSNRIYTSSVSPIVDNKWHHFVASSSTSSIALYIDGVLIGQTNTTAPSLSTSASLYVGSNDDSYYGYKGLMSNVIIENKARTAQEIAKYYNQTKSLYGL